MSLSKFSIDDAFDSDEDDNVRVYGSTKQTPVKGPKVRAVTSDEIPLTECQYDFVNQNERALLPSEKTRDQTDVLMTLQLPVLNMLNEEPKPINQYVDMIPNLAIK
ncbi:hypothetical protein FSP39_020273 [Pinctada imbricata]|uniref:Uncharacterized protein n=1 Tax=Pinctada imbricata TaxID=66713 RepID=A0AA88XI12_PINIB|nr:hypothetical protein FSP39_020273 [Pinctada imbricata]